MPYFRQRSFVFAPASASFSTAMICSSLKRFAFIVRSHWADSTLSPYYSRGAPQTRFFRRELTAGKDKKVTQTSKSIWNGYAAFGPARKAVKQLSAAVHIDRVIARGG
jgi:hypothetical protein